MITADERQELFELIRHRSFKTGHFKLASGRESNLYFNLKPTLMHPRGAELAALALLTLIYPLHPDYVGGLEMGAVPNIGAMAALSSSRGQPLATIFMRKKAKSHGTQDSIEGLGPDENLQNKNVFIVDDVATSGQSILIAAQAALTAGAKVSHAACIVDREEGGAELLKEHGITLHAVFKAKEFLK